MLNKVIISGGGTGGHIFPAIAIANEIKKRNPLAEILFIGALGRMEMEKVPNAGYKIIGLPISGIQRKLTLSNLLVPFKLIKSIYMAKKIIRDFKPEIVVGVGGYASSATLYAANALNIPTLIQEQNSYAGLTNKWLSKKVDIICVAYENMEKFFPKSKIKITGNPVREELLQAHHISKAEAKKTLGFDQDKSLILVIGGSLGARTINQAMQNNLDTLINNNCQLLWQTGKNFKATIDSKTGIKASEFIYEMNVAYAAADVVISRAGAISVSELTLIGKPTILVPSPNVTDDHQTKNAMALVNQNACVLVNDMEASTMLISTAIKLIKDKTWQNELSKSIIKLSKPNALNDIVNEIETLKK
jgi:UDP-N-acetylglucosamine--N-acetylmuramyl-(pentapeptide) pyrophosphoryl-undecaprenol N-acetylglucosamine transferase